MVKEKKIRKFVKYEGGVLIFDILYLCVFFYVNLFDCLKKCEE